MKNSSKTIVFFGSGPVAAESLAFLAEHFDIEVVFTKAVPSHHKGIAPVEALAKKIGLPTIFASNKTELDQLLFDKKPSSRLGIVVDYGVIMSASVINYFELGIINSHFSLLPEWRGADPITFSLLSGQEKTGVSLMVIEPTLDTGKLITQKSLKINSDDNNSTLTTKLINLSNQLMLTYLPRYISGDIKPHNQPHPNRATYSTKLTKADGIIDWSKPAAKIEREIRAYLGWPGSVAQLADKRVIIKSARITDTKEDLLDMKCGDGRYLSIEELVAPSGRLMNAKEFINGYGRLLS